MKCPSCEKEMVLSPNVLLSEPPQYQYECPACFHPNIIVSEEEMQKIESEKIINVQFNFPFILNFQKCNSLNEVCELLNKCNITVYSQHPEYHYLKEKYS